jgi:hypothetical protein
MSTTLPAPIPGADTREVGVVQMAVAPAGSARVTRVIHPPGFRWSTHMEPITIGFLRETASRLGRPDVHRHSG